MNGTGCLACWKGTELLNRGMVATSCLRWCAVGIAILFGALPGDAASDCGKPPDVDFLLGFLAGEYRVVGQMPDGGGAYVGRIELKPKTATFELSRDIAGVTTKGTAFIETAGEGCPVLRIQFSLGAVDYEGTFQWRSDLDNYARMTGYIYRRNGETKSPGLEAWFPLTPINGVSPSTPASPPPKETPSPAH